MKALDYRFRSRTPILMLAFAAMFLHGCIAELELFSVEETGIMSEGESSLLAESNVGRYTSDGAYILENPARLAPEFREVKISRSVGSSPQLYIMKNGVPQYVAEVVDESTVKFLQSGIERPLPGRLYTIEGDGVRVRTGPFKNDYNVFAHVSRDQIALVLGPEQDGFFQVQLIGVDTIGWISTLYLAPAVDSTFNGRQTEIQSRYMNGTVCEKYQTIDGLKSGQYYIYHTNGRLWSQRTYAHGKLVTVISNIDANGNSLNIGSFADGNGSLNIYDESGKLIYIENYSNGYLMSTQNINNQQATFHHDIYSGTAQPYNGIGQPYNGAGKPYTGGGQPYNGDGHPYTGDGHPYNGGVNRPVPHDQNSQTNSQSSSSVIVVPINSVSKLYTGVYNDSLTVNENAVIAGVVDGPLTIGNNCNVVVSGVINGPIIIGENSKLTVGGIIGSNIIIQKNAILINNGTINGAITNYGGQIENHGTISGR